MNEIMDIFHDGKIVHILATLVTLCIGVTQDVISVSHNGKTATIVMENDVMYIDV